MEEILIIDDSLQICSMLSEFVLPELGFNSVIANTGRQGLARLRQHLPDLILLDLQLPDISGLDLLRLIAQEGHDVPVILMTAHGSEAIAVEAFRLGARNYLIKPFSEAEAQMVIDQALRERRLTREKDQLTKTLRQKVQELTVLYSIGKSVSALLDQDELLVRIVEASVYITRAEEGFLLLRSPDGDELLLRAAKNIGDQRAHLERTPIDNTIAGQVIRTGKPMRVDQNGRNIQVKIKTGFLVRAILQVPLIVGSDVIGVLSVDNRQSDRIFSENDQYLLSALADYAAIAIENVRLYQRALRDEERYRNLFAHAHDLIFTLDVQLAFTSVNAACLDRLGREEHALLGQPLRLLVVAAERERALRSFGEVLRGRDVPPFVMSLTNLSGDLVVLEISARRVQEGPSALAVHCIARDLTDRRKLEEQLIRSEKLSAIGQLVAGVAHEVNNPLTSISGYTQLMLRDNNLPAAALDDLRHIGMQAERAARIVQNLLVFAREHKPERMATDVNEVLRSTLNLRAYQLRVDNVRVVQQFGTALAATVADPFQLQQVFLNLINNAQQAMVERGGPGILTLRTSDGTRTSATGVEEQTLIIAVGDTGTGIPAEALNRIFDPFYTTKPVGQGTGLGLSICFGIIQEHGGRIWAESEVGAGTTMVVELPVMVETEEGYEPVPQVPPMVEMSPVQQCRVLVVDDEEAVGQLLARLLRDIGHEPLVVTSGAAAIAAIEQGRFDLMLSDIKMPGLNGFELYEQVRLRDPDLATRIAFITGDTVTAATQAKLAQIGNPYLAKPFSIERLGALVRNLLAQRVVTSNT